MNNIKPVIRTDDRHHDPLPGLEHLDVRYADVDHGDTWIGDLFTAARRHALKLTLWVLVCFGTSLIYAHLASREYVASAQIALEPHMRPAPGTTDAAGAVPVLDSAQTESQLQIVRSVRNLTYVFNTLNLASDPVFAPKQGILNRLVSNIVGSLSFLAPPKSSPEQAIDQAREIAFQNFADRVQARRVGQSYVIEVSFRGPQPDTTARIANSIAAAYIRDQVLARGSSEERGTEFLQGRIALIQAEKKAADEAVVTGVITDYQFPDSDARIVGAALRPLAAAYPQTKLILLFGTVVGFVTGVGFIAVIDRFDQTVRSSAQIRRVLGVDCLVVAPRLQSGRLSDSIALDQPESDFARSMRLLRTVIFAARSPAYSIAVGFVSCEEGNGCTTLCANLANLLAATNSRVVLIDANLQQPDLTRHFAPDSKGGLDQFIMSSSATVDLPEVRLTSSLGFIPAVAADHKADPNVFLGTQAMRAVLAHYKGAADLLLDLPPIASSSDAQAIGGILSGVVLVAALNRTKLNELSAAVRALRSTNSRVLGLVLNDPSPRDTSERRRRFL